MKIASSKAELFMGGLALAILGCVMLLIMIERVEVAVGADECAGMAENFRQADFAPGTARAGK